LYRPSADGFSLATVRASLIRQEETIIFALIERAQFAANRDVYEPDAYVPPSQSTGRIGL
jgi:chorismate mutase